MSCNWLGGTDFGDVGSWLWCERNIRDARRMLDGFSFVLLFAPYTLDVLTSFKLNARNLSRFVHMEARVELVSYSSTYLCMTFDLDSSLLQINLPLGTYLRC